MKRNFVFIIVSVIIIVAGFLVYQTLTKKEVSMPEKDIIGKKIAMIIAFKDFQDEEYSVTKNILTAAGAEIVTVSDKKGTAMGAYGGEADVDLSLDELNIADYDAILFIGGSGAQKYIDDAKAHQIAKNAFSQNKLLAAICISPTILAKAGVLEGKRATVWTSPLDKSAVKILVDDGVIYQDEAVVVDGKIITANGPQASQEFSEAIIEALQ